MTTEAQRKFYENSKMWGKKRPETVLERARLTAKAVPSDAHRVLEVGSGDGLIIKALRKAGHDPVALDISQSALKHIQSSKLVQATGNQLPFPSNSFDLVLACELLEHLPVSIYQDVLDEIARVTKRYIIITVPYQEKLEWNYARCPVCGCIFNGAYHVRSFGERDMKFLFRKIECINLKGIVKLPHPDRTISLELFIRHRLAREYLYTGPSITCPVCLSTVDKRPRRNWIGWIASGMRNFYRMIYRKKIPLWYLAVYEKQ
ncbi:MAG: methyltransferase domain-containing protein [Candidatus Aminicenantes bacterium]|nr:methyltransferase domain-containing protein [Candidatus Aminicenantes bacterium]